MIGIAAGLYMLSQPLAAAAPSGPLTDDVGIIEPAGVATGEIRLRIVIAPHSVHAAAAVPRSERTRPAPYRRDVLRQGRSTVIMYYQ